MVRVEEMEGGKKLRRRRVAGVAPYKCSPTRIEAPMIEKKGGRAEHDERGGRRRIGEVVGGSGRVGNSNETERVKSGGVVNIRENEHQQLDEVDKPLQGSSNCRGGFTIHDLHRPLWEFLASAHTRYIRPIIFPMILMYASVRSEAAD